MSFVFISEEFAALIKNNLKKGSGYWSSVKNELKIKAEEAMRSDPWSVTFYKSPAVSGDIHDYYSEGGYWWPDPEDPDGPYIRRDGEYNPDRFTSHHEAMRKMCMAAFYLSSAGYYFDERSYFDRAVYILKTWFVDNATKMNPHLEYGQAIKGACEGRGIGIIDTNALLLAVHAMGFISEHLEYGGEIKQFKEWFKVYLHWLTSSKKGIDEKNELNNHGSWWNAQATAYAVFVGNDNVFRDCCDIYKEKMIPSMDTDGSFMHEIKRTKAMQYSLFNIDACAVVCEIACNKGLDLWHYKTAEGKSMELATRFMMPYLDNPFLWPYKQIDGEVPDENYCFQMAAIRLGMKDCVRINNKRAADKYLVRDQKPLGPLILLRS